MVGSPVGSLHNYRCSLPWKKASFYFPLPAAVPHGQPMPLTCPTVAHTMHVSTAGDAGQDRRPCSNPPVGTGPRGGSPSPAAGSGPPPQLGGANRPRAGLGAPGHGRHRGQPRCVARHKGEAFSPRPDPWFWGRPATRGQLTGSSTGLPANLHKKPPVSTQKVGRRNNPSEQTRAGMSGGAAAKKIGGQGGETAAVSRAPPPHPRVRRGGADSGKEWGERPKKRRETFQAAVPRAPRDRHRLRRGGPGPGRGKGRPHPPHRSLQVISGN